MKPSPVEGRGEVDVGKGVPSHYKSWFFLSLSSSIYFIVIALN